MGRSLEIIDNPFYSPLDNVLIKGVEEDGKWIVYLEASNEITDQEGETVNMAALQKAADYYLSHGVLSWDHKQKQTHDPKYIIGEPLEVKFTDDKRTLVKGFLYQSNEVAKSVWDNIKSGATILGASIGGGILSKAQSKIKQIIWDETALTHKPVNDSTLGNVQMVPYAEFAKALMAGAGVDAGSFTGGRALIGESLQGNTVDILPSQNELKIIVDEVLSEIVLGNTQDFNDVVGVVLSKGYTGDTADEIVKHVVKSIRLQ